MIFSRIAVISALVMGLAGAVQADAVSDALQGALDAYKANDLGKTSEQMTLATQALGAQQSGLLAALLPAAPTGWTRADTADFSKSFGIMGGGAGAEATYTSADGGGTFKMSLIADNPMVSSMGVMLGNAQMMAMMGKVVKVGDQTLLSEDGSISTLINTRVLFQAEGGTEQQMLPLIQTMDFAKIGVFDKK
jgi:hypothetical protein